MTFVFGALAALAAPFVMTIGFIVWDNHWKGSAFALNLFKCNLASVAFLVVTVSFGTLSFEGEAVGYLILSSTIGIIIGDWTWLQGLKMLGATRVIFVDSVKPFLAAVMGWAVLGESLKLTALGGIVLTVLGILLVSLAEEKQKEDNNESANYSDCSVTGEQHDEEEAEEEQREQDQVQQMPDDQKSDKEKDADEQTEVVDSMEWAGVDACSVNLDQPPSPETSAQQSDSTENEAVSLRVGYLYSGINVVLDTYGSLLTKQFAGHMTPWEISLVRFGFAGAVMLIVSVVFHARDQFGKKDDSTEDSTAWYSLPTLSWHSWMKIVGGVSLVTFLTPLLSNYALLEIALGLALTLTSVGPLYALPLSWWLRNERPTITAWIGALLTVGGVAVLSLFGKTE